MSTATALTAAPRPMSPSPLPSASSKVVGVLALVLALSTSAILVLGALQASPISWTLASIQILSVVACLVAGLTFAGKNAVSPSMALLCASGAILTAAGLSHLSSGTVVVINQPMRTWTVFSTCASLLMGLSAALAALSPHPESLRRAVRGLCWSIPFVVIAAVFVLPAGARLTGWLSSQPSIVRIAGYTFSSVAAFISLCASVDLVITAFQRAGRPSNP